MFKKNLKLQFVDDDVDEEVKKIEARQEEPRQPP